MYKARCDSLLLLHHANKRAVAHVGQGRRGAGGFRTPPQVPEGRLLSLATDTHCKTQRMEHTLPRRAQQAAQRSLHAHLCLRQK